MPTSPFNPVQVDTELNKRLPECSDLANIRRWSEQGGLPEIQVSEQQARFLELLARTAKAKRILEVGTLGGYSTYVLSRAARVQGGRVTSIEYDLRHADAARTNLYAVGVYNVEVIVGDAHEVMAELPNNTYDFIFIDADKESNKDYFELSDLIGTDDVTIVVDNVIRDGRVISPLRPEKMEFIEFLGSHPGFDVSVVQTVGSKGWDGFVLAKRKVQF